MNALSQRQQATNSLYATQVLRGSDVSGAVKRALCRHSVAPQSGHVISGSNFPTQFMCIVRVTAFLVSKMRTNKYYKQRFYANIYYLISEQIILVHIFSNHQLRSVKYITDMLSFTFLFFLHFSDIS